ncbi:MAG: ethanolamine utilization protein [Methylococcus sp.]|jgi:DNA polymerase-3 subunit epsilon|nr:MAG: ethanolamine utilization protein [Methylococcus sp.]
MQQLAFVDLETTGATASLDRITEIGIILVDESGVQEWSSLVNPETRISGFTERLSGISNEMVANEPRFCDLANRVYKMLEGRILVAHNARFDYAFLKQSFMREGIDFSAKTLCTVKLSRRLYPSYPKHNLDTLIERHGLKVSGRHRALADAQLIHQFWEKIQATIPQETIQSALKALLGRPSTPMHIDLTMIDGLPEAPGVYLFYGENDLPLYVGKSVNIRQRVMSHFTADVTSAKEMSLSQQVRRIEHIRTGGEIGALLQEAALVKKLQPTHNRQLRRNNELCSIQLKEASEGLKVHVAYANALDFATTSNLYGLFKSKREALKALTEIAGEHNLCKAIIGLEKVKVGSPCFGRQLKKCRGACIGDEARLAHDARLLAGLGKLKIRTWPFDGPAYIKEGEEMLLIENWAYLGSARSEEDIWNLMNGRDACFNRDTYKILLATIGQLQPLRLKVVS